MRLAIAAAIVALASPALAQHQHHQPQQQHQTPYAGMHQRGVKALSDQQIADLRAGRGMGLALAAELNGYPGPMHVLELADQLDLTADQRTKVRQLFDSMKAEAIPVGTKLIEQETELDRMFASRTITAERLKTMTSSIAATQGALRDTHLKYHLSTAAILSQHQMRRYADLRGCAGGDANPQHQHRRHH
jgi:Spy/CpxP family protein refolding chaperone